MAHTASALIKIAEAEIGYHEKANNANLDSKTANSGSNNYQKYGRDLNKAGYYNGNKNGYDWCDQFVDWCFFKLCGTKKKAEYLECQTGDLGAGCGFSMQYYKNAGRFDKNPKVGDQIFFKYSNDSSTADHTGIVVKVTNTQIETIEGNSNNQVRRRTYSRSNSTILGYGHPRFDAETKTTPTTVSKTKTCTVTLPIIRKGNTGAAVKTLQRLLRQLEYVGSDGKLLAVDGKFGPGTEAALIRWQKKHLGSADGICGVKTWTKLLRG